MNNKKSRKTNKLPFPKSIRIKPSFLQTKNVITKEMREERLKLLLEKCEDSYETNLFQDETANNLTNGQTDT